MVATCTASLRLEKTTNKNMYSRGNTATYVPLLCGIAAFLFLCGIAANVFLRHCRKCLRCIAAFVSLRHCRKCVRGILPFVFRSIFQALPLVYKHVLFAFIGNKMFVTPVSLIAKISTT